MSGVGAGIEVSKYFAARHRESMERKLRRMRRQANNSTNELVDRVEQLEDDFGRALLLLITLADLCVQKGVLTRKEIADMAEQLDLSDGTADGKLDPEVMRPPAECASEPWPVTPKEHLRKLEEEADG
ncbi:MAG: hypothetical protein DWQ35_10930 [Planctomycetota bacterium]|nr:MAG: hypothetical protein DWQ35_10930 [Planctomycetota bacterium]REK23369.1 MAG: hypothetical protein DWQ42_15515 [Planctomycetota bacterium]REK47172.1 MAG: hypothetical protein DWQ46_04895 [Planctomycetota bacterium]